MTAIDDTKKLIQQHMKRLTVLEEKQAAQGLDTPPEVVTEIESIQGKISDLQQELIHLSSLDIVGAYASDRGQSLREEKGEAVAEAAGQLYDTVLAKVGEIDPRTAKKYPDNPSGYTAPLADALKDALDELPDAVKALSTLIEKYDQAVATSSTTYTASLSGPGAIAQGDGSTAVNATGGGIAIGGNVGGDVKIGGADD